MRTLNVYSLHSANPRGMGEIDSRIKILLVVAGFIAIFTASSWILLVTYCLFGLTLLRIAGIPFRKLVLHVVPVLFLALFVVLSQLFLNAGTPWVTLKFGSYQLIGSMEGLQRGIFIALRMLSAVSMMFCLTLTTPVHEWIQALEYFRLPKSIIEIMTLAYSSLFVLLEEVDRLQKAQRMRLGGRTWWAAVQSVSTVGGILFIRIFDKSQRLEVAMRCRGYNGKLGASRSDWKWRGADWVYLSLGLILIGGSWIALRFF